LTWDMGKVATFCNVADMLDAVWDSAVTAGVTDAWKKVCEYSRSLRKDFH